MVEYEVWIFWKTKTEAVFMYLTWHVISWKSTGLVYQKQVWRAGTSNYIPQYLWDVITCPWPSYLHTVLFVISSHWCFFSLEKSPFWNIMIIHFFSCPSAPDRLQSNDCVLYVIYHFIFDIELAEKYYWYRHNPNILRNLLDILGKIVQWIFLLSSYPFTFQESSL